MEDPKIDPLAATEADYSKTLADFQQARSSYLSNANQTPWLNSITPQFKQEPILNSEQFQQSIKDSFSNPSQWADPYYEVKPYSFETGQGNKDFNRFAQSSLYNKLGYVPGENNENLYHENQSTLSRLGNAGVNIFNKGAAYALQNFGLVLGAPAYAVTGNISNMTDNFMVRAANVLKDYTQDHNPIYKGDQYIKGSIWDKLTSTDWWLDDAADRFTLVLGMFAPTFLAAGAAMFAAPEEAGIGLGAAALGEGTGVGTIAKNFVSTFLGQLKNNPQLFTTVGKSVVPKMLSAMTGSEIGATEALARYAPTLNYAEGTAWNIIGQSGLNGSETQGSIRKALNERRASGDPQFVNLSDKDIEDKAAEGARNSFLETIPLALAGSFLEVPAMFRTSRGLKSLFDATFNSKTAAIALKELTPSITKGIVLDVLTGIEHGQNEAGQVAVSNYNLRRATGENVQGVLPGLFGEFMDHRDDPNFQNNEALGTIQGILMGGFGGIKARLTGQYKAQEENRKNFLDIQNEDRLKRRIWTGDLNQRDQDGNLIIGPDGKPVPDIDHVVDGGLSLLGLQNDLALKQEVIKQGAFDLADHLDRQQLAGFSHGFFFEPEGMKHLKGWMAMERDNQTRDPNYELNNGISPEQQYQKNLKTIEELKVIHDQTFDNQHTVRDLELGPEDADKLKYVPGFLSANRFSQYMRAADQHFANEKLSDINSGLSRLYSKAGLFGKTELELDSKGDPIYKPFKSPSSPDEVDYNNLLKRKEPMENVLKNSRQSYKTLQSKTKLREAFDKHVDEMNAFSQAAKDLTEKMEAAKTAPVTPQTPVTPAPEPVTVPVAAPEAKVNTRETDPAKMDPGLRNELQGEFERVEKERTNPGDENNREPGYGTLENFIDHSPEAKVILDKYYKQGTLADILTTPPTTFSTPPVKTPEVPVNTKASKEPVETIASRFIGKILYFTAGTGKTYLTQLGTFPNLVDGDDLLIRYLKEATGEDITHDNLPKKLLDYFKSNRNAAELMYSKVLDEMRSLAKEGKTIITGTRRFIPQADYVFKTTSDTNLAKRVGKANVKSFRQGEQEQILSGDKKSIPVGEQKVKEALMQEPSSGTFTIQRSDVLKKIKEAKNAEELKKASDDAITEIASQDNPNTIEITRAIADKQIQLNIPFVNMTEDELYKQSKETLDTLTDETVNPAITKEDEDTAKQNTSVKTSASGLLGKVKSGEIKPEPPKIDCG